MLQRIRRIVDKRVRKGSIRWATDAITSVEYIAPTHDENKRLKVTFPTSKLGEGHEPDNEE